MDAKDASQEVAKLAKSYYRSVIDPDLEPIRISPLRDFERGELHDESLANFPSY